MPSDASGSRTSRAASLSCGPVARCGLRVEGACQYRTFRSPPWPRFATGAPDELLGVGLGVEGTHAAPRSATTDAIPSAARRRRASNLLQRADPEDQPAF